MEDQEITLHSCVSFALIIGYNLLFSLIKNNTVKYDQSMFMYFS